jgi:hypothetical protein
MQEIVDSLLNIIIVKKQNNLKKEQDFTIASKRSDRVYEKARPKNIRWLKTMFVAITFSLR